MYFRSSGKKTAPSEKKTHKKQQYIKTPSYLIKDPPSEGDLLDFRSLPSVGHFGGQGSPLATAQRFNLDAQNAHPS